MRRTRIGAIVGGLALAGAVLAPATAAQADVSPGAALRITVTKTGGIDPGPMPTPLADVTLTCDPDGGTHPTPEKACAELKEIRGNLDRLATGDGTHFCPLYYDPVRVRIVGTWYGQDKKFEHQYTNLACMHAAVYPYTDIIPA